MILKHSLKDYMAMKSFSTFALALVFNELKDKSILMLVSPQNKNVLVNVRGLSPPNKCLIRTAHTCLFESGVNTASLACTRLHPLSPT